MKKKIFAAALSIALAAGVLAGCGASGNSSSTQSSSAQSSAAGSEQTSSSAADESDSSAASEQTSSAQKTSGNSKILVIYFDQGMNSVSAGSKEADAVTSASLAGSSPSGVTINDIRVMKNEIVKKTGADEYAVVINEKYADDYNDMVDQAQEDQDNDKQFTFANALPDLSSYDTIFVGMPVWWGGLPQPMVNVFEQMYFSGKQIIPFGIHLGSSFGSMVDQIKEMEPDADVSDDGLTENSHTSNSEVTSDVDEWLSGLGY